MYGLDDYFGITSEQLQAQTHVSSNAPVTTSQAGPHPAGQPGVVPSFTDWQHSPVFWLAVFAVFALGMIHVEGSVKAALR